MNDQAAATIDLTQLDPSEVDPKVFDPDAVAKIVASTPEPKLQEAMSGPLRSVIVGEVFRRMPERLTQSAASTAAVINWEISASDGDADRYTVVVEHGECTVSEGHHESPRVTLTMDAVTFLKLVTGNVNPVTAFMAGQIAIQGDLMFAASVTALFDIPNAGGAQG